MYLLNLQSYSAQVTRNVGVTQRVLIARMLTQKSIDSYAKHEPEKRNKKKSQKTTQFVIKMSSLHAAVQLSDYSCSH